MKITVSKLPELNLLTIRQEKPGELFIADRNSIVIGLQSLSSLLLFLTKNGFISHRMLEGILEEYFTDKGD